jgi:DNA-binding GntR family transcriptional regulator
VRHRVGQSIAEHAELSAALQAGDEERAARAARQHVLVQGERFTDLISMVNQRNLQPSDN